MDLDADTAAVIGALATALGVALAAYPHLRAASARTVLTRRLNQALALRKELPADDPGYRRIRLAVDAVADECAARIVLLEERWLARKWRTGLAASLQARVMIASIAVVAGLYLVLWAAGLENNVGVAVAFAALAGVLGLYGSYAAAKQNQALIELRAQIIAARQRGARPSPGAGS